MKNILFIGCLSILITSCASLSKSQLDAVNHFAKTSANFSNYPDKIVREMAEVRMQRSLYMANGLNNVNDHLDELDYIHQDRLDDEKLASEINITFQIIDQYAQTLALLSSSTFDEEIKTQAYTLGKDLDSLIKINNKLSPNRQLPLGIGAGVSNLMRIAGSQYIRTKQSKEVKKFVLAADTLVSGMTKHLIQFLESGHFNDLIKIEESLKNDYRNFLDRHNKSNQLDFDREYLELKQKIEHIKAMRKQTISATKTLAQAHHSIAKNLQKKQKLKERIQALQMYNDEVKNIQKIAIELSKLNDYEH